MPDNLNVDFTADYRAVIDALNQSAKGSDRASDALDRQSKSAAMVVGPYQRLIRLQSQLRSAAAKGTNAQVKDINAALTRTQRQIHRLEHPPGAGDRLAHLIRSTRISSSGEVLPLVGQLLDSFGPLGIALGTATTLFAKLTLTGNETVKAIRQMQQTTGASGIETGVLSSIGSATGLTPEQVASLADDLQQRITTDPFAMTLSRRGGFYNTPLPYGNPDLASGLVKAVDTIRKEAQKDPVQALRDARLIGPAGQIGIDLAKLPDDQYNALKKNGLIAAAIDDKDAQAKQMQAQAAAGGVIQAIGNVGTAVFKKNADNIIAFLNDLGGDVNKGAVYINKYKSGVPMPTGVGAPGSHTSVSFASASPHARAMMEHAKALEKHTVVMEKQTRQNDAQPGVYGHGYSDRMDRAVPGAFGYGQGGALDQQRHAGGMALGVVLPG